MDFAGSTHPTWRRSWVGDDIEWVPASQKARAKWLNKVPDTHSVSAVCDHNFGVFTVTEIAMENADAVSPAHPVTRTPKTANPRLRRCGGSSVPLAFLTGLAAWQSLCTGHLDASLELFHLASTDRSAEQNLADLGQTARLVPDRG